MSKALEFIEKFPVREHSFKTFIKRAQNNIGADKYPPDYSLR